MGINAGSHHLLFWSRQLQPNNLPANKVWQRDPSGATQTSTRVCPIPLVYMGVGIKSWELMLVSTISTFFCPTVKLGTTSGIHISFIFCLFNFSIDCPSFGMSSPSCVLLYITVWSLPWLYALECVRAMQRAVQHSRVQTQRHRGEKNKQLEGKLVNRVLDGSGYSNLFFSKIPYSNYKIFFNNFSIFYLFYKKIHILTASLVLYMVHGCHWGSSSPAWLKNVGRDRPASNIAVCRCTWAFEGIIKAAGTSIATT